MEMNSCRGELTDVLVKKEALLSRCAGFEMDMLMKPLRVFQRIPTAIRCWFARSQPGVANMAANCFMQADCLVVFTLVCTGVSR